MAVHPPVPPEQEAEPAPADIEVPRQEATRITRGHAKKRFGSGQSGSEAQIVGLISHRNGLPSVGGRRHRRLRKEGPRYAVQEYLVEILGVAAHRCQRRQEERQRARQILPLQLIPEPRPVETGDADYPRRPLAERAQILRDDIEIFAVRGHMLRTDTAGLRWHRHRHVVQEETVTGSQKHA